MKISPLKFQTTTKTQKASTNQINFQNRITNSIHDTYRYNVVKDPKSEQIELDIKYVKEFAKIIKSNARVEDLLKRTFVKIAQMNDFKMYTPVNADATEKILFINLDNPEKNTRMESYSFKNGMKLQRSYEFYDDIFKNYKLDVFDEKDTRGNGTDLQYIITNGKLAYHKLFYPAMHQGAETVITKDGIMYQNGLFDKNGDITFSKCQIFLANDRKDTTCTLYNEDKDIYETYQYDKYAKQWQKKTILV